MAAPKTPKALTTFRDTRGRDWTVRITGETICAATGRGIDLDLGKLMGGGMSLQALGVMLELCWLGVQHNARIGAERITEQEFKASLHGHTTTAALEATVAAVAECFGMEVQPADPTGGAAASAKPSA